MVEYSKKEIKKELKNMEIPYTPSLKKSFKNGLVVGGNKPDAPLRKILVEFLARMTEEEQFFIGLEKQRKVEEKQRKKYAEHDKEWPKTWNDSILRGMREERAFEYINCTPHVIVLNDGRKFAPEGILPRVTNNFSEKDEDFFSVSFGEVENLPAPEAGKIFIVSGMVKQAVPEREDVVSPASGHPETVRSSKGFIVSVPGFIR